MHTKVTLGYLGFLPFATLTILPWIFGETFEEISFQLLVVYGGIIISFLSGIIWGIDTTNQNISDFGKELVDGRVAIQTALSELESALLDSAEKLIPKIVDKVGAISLM